MNLFKDPFASHVYQAFLHTLSGRPQKNLCDSRTSKKRKTEHADAVVQTPSSFADLQSKLVNIVKQWDQTLLQDLVFDKYVVLLLQTIIEKDVPKKVRKKAKKATGDRTLSEFLLFGNDSESEGNPLRFHL